MSTYGDTWSEWYDRIHVRDDDLAFWTEEARFSGGPVLELGCGTGRVAIPMAQTGIQVVGLDNSRELLSIARGKARSLRLSRDQIQFTYGDMRRFSLKQQFPLVCIPFNSFLLLLSVAEQFQALLAIRKHLIPSGRLIIDIFVPDLDRLVSDPSVETSNGELLESDTDHQLILREQSFCDNFNQIITARNMIEERDPKGNLEQAVLKEYQLRYIHRFEMQHLLAAAGYNVLDVYGSYERHTLDEEDPRMLWVATPN